MIETKRNLTSELPDIGDVEFDEAKHQYIIGGRKVPSVTQLVAPLGADYDEPDDDLELTIEAAADRGTAMHAYIAHRLNGGSEDDFELPDSYLGYAEAVELFLSEHSVVPLLIETPLGGVGCAGTPDLVCEFDGVLSIVDYKFVSSVAKSKVGAQLAGYSEICGANGIFPEKLYAVQFLKSGDYRLYPVEPVAALEAFYACLNLYTIKTQVHPRGKIFRKETA